MKFKIKKKKTKWECFECGEIYLNTLRYCPACEIAKIHSDNLRKSDKKKKLKNKK